jgi:hypothetical protein
MSKRISWREINGKIVISKEGVFMALQKEQIPQLKAVLSDIESGAKEFYQEDARKLHSTGVCDSTLRGAQE